MRSAEPEAGDRRVAPPWQRSSRTLAQFSVYEGLQLAAGELARQVVELLKPHGLSPSQYNVLRILRGAGEAGMACGQVGGRLIHHDPDVTRLLDRLERRGLIERVRDARDRRVVRTYATPKAVALLAELDAPVDALHEAQFGHLSERRLAEVRAILDEVRSRRE